MDHFRRTPDSPVALYALAVLLAAAVALVVWKWWG
jgi:hypothetical protein